MTVKYFCNRCDEPGDITSRRFKTGIDVTTTQAQEPAHLCDNCLAAAMLEAVVGMADTPTARDFAETKRKAAECSRAYAQVERGVEEIAALKEKLLAAKNETTTSARYDSWLHERGELLAQIDEHKQAREVAEAKAAQLERSAADQAKRETAAAEQAKHDGDYLAAVAKREAKRVGAR